MSSQEKGLLAKELDTLEDKDKIEAFIEDAEIMGHEDIAEKGRRKIKDLEAKANNAIQKVETTKSQKQTVEKMGGSEEVIAEKTAPIDAKIEEKNKEIKAVEEEAKRKFEIVQEKPKVNEVSQQEEYLQKKKSERETYLQENTEDLLEIFKNGEIFKALDDFEKKDEEYKNIKAKNEEILKTGRKIVEELNKAIDRIPQSKDQIGTGFYATTKEVQDLKAQKDKLWNSEEAVKLRNELNLTVEARYESKKVLDSHLSKMFGFLNKIKSISPEELKIKSDLKLIAQNFHDKWQDTRPGAKRYDETARNDYDREQNDTTRENFVKFNNEVNDVQAEKKKLNEALDEASSKNNARELEKILKNSGSDTKIIEKLQNFL